MSKFSVQKKRGFGTEQKKMECGLRDSIIE